jgi:hypothetical protein
MRNEMEYREVPWIICEKAFFVTFCCFGQKVKINILDRKEGLI